MAEAPTRPRVAVVIPVFNAASDLDRCLAALAGSDWPDFEVLVVDDASDSPEVRRVAEARGASFLRLDRNRGPAAARNEGVRHVSGDILLFVDADVLVHGDTISRAVEALEDGADAVFGSYDDHPAHPSFLSQYRNLYHRWVHQQSPEQASTFWSGCGAIRRAAFEAVGGFDPGFRKPGIEDIELGYRLVDDGRRIALRKDMQCTHTKHWTLANMVRTDIFARGAPWVALLLRHRDKATGLNLNPRARIATMAAGLLLAVLPLAWLDPRWLGLWVPLVGAIVSAQWGFYRYVARLRGWVFALATVPAQVLFFACCAAAVPLGVARWLGDRRA